MAIEPQDEKDLEDGGAADGDSDGDPTRRRRRRSMRVPSDDVPRPNRPASISGPVEGEPVHVESDIEFDVDVDPVEDGGNGHAREDGLGIDVDMAETDVAAVESGRPIESTPPALQNDEGLPETEAQPPVAAEAPAGDTAPTEPEPAPPVAAAPEPEKPEEPPAKPASPETLAAIAAATGAPEEEELSPLELEEEVSSAASPPPPPTPAATKAPSPPKPPPPRLAVAAAAALEPRPKKRKTRAWFEEIFDEDYLRTLPFLTPQTTQREAAFLIEGLAIKPGHHVLDIGCGYGRHAMELAARGFHVLALDLSLPLLLRGADEAQRRGLNINFVHGDMRELHYDGQFDGAYCVFSTFGFFDDDTNKRVAQGIARALKPGGRLVLDILNRDYIITDLPTRVWWEGDGCVVLEEVDFNYFNSRILSQRQIVFEDGHQLEQEISIRAYSLHEVGKVLHGAGFRVLQVSGGMAAKGRFFGKDSRQIIVVAEKRQEGAASGTAPADAPPDKPR